MTTRAHPPKPHLMLRVGVTGHRLNKLPTDRREAVRATIGQTLRCLAAAASSVHRAHGWAFDPRPPELRLVSALAEGTDTFAAEEGRAAHYVLEAPLPLDPEEYKKDFVLPVSAGTLDRLSGGEARAALVIAADAIEGGEAREARYEAAGRMVLAQSDVLIAVWDGAPGAGRGGTRQMIEEAQRRGIVVLWLDPVATAAPRLWVADGERGAWQDLPDLMPTGSCAAPLLGARIADLLAPPSDGPAGHRGGHGAGPTARERLERFYAEPYRSRTLWSAYDWLRVFRGDWSGRSIRIDLGERAATEAKAWTDFFRPIEGRIGESLERSLREVLRRRFVHADNAAVYFSHVYRSAYVVNFLLAAAAVIVGLAAVFAWDNTAVKFWSVVVELGLILLIVYFTRRGIAGRWHQRWLDYRRLAEMLRPARMMALIGRAPDVARGADDAADDGTRWIAWYARATLREIGLPAATIDRAYLDRAAAAALDDEIGRPARGGRPATGQIGYHLANRDRLMALEHGIERVGYLSFVATAVVAATFIVGYLIGKHLSPTMAAGVKLAKPLFTMLGAGLPAIGASLAGIRAQADFRSFADRSDTTASRLLPIAGRLEDPARAKTLESLERDFGAATEAMMSDLRVWRLIYRNRELALPA